MIIIEQHEKIYNINKLYLIITFTIYLNINFKYSFKRYKYIIIKVQFYKNLDKYSLCLNSGYIINLIDQQFLKKNIKNIMIYKINTPIIVIRIGKTKYNISKYILLNLYFLIING